MKKTITFILMALITLSLIACGSKTKDTNIYDIINIFDDVPENIIVADVYEIEKLTETFSKTKFRVCGIITEVDTSYKTFDVINLSFNDEEIHAYLIPNQKPLVGEYVEIVGFLDIDSSYEMSNLNKCTITERGNSVRDRLEK